MDAGFTASILSPRGNMRKIGARDRHAAARIAEIREQCPQARIVTLLGKLILLPIICPVAAPEAPQDEILRPAKCG